MRKHIPNMITLLNLACGTVAIVLALEGQWQGAVYLVLVAAVLDFLDGTAARLLKAGSEVGKQLDSLSDMVSFGILPTVFVYLIFRSHFVDWLDHMAVVPSTLIQLSILVIPLCSAIRLARFNISDDTSGFFSGLPTPAHALFWTGLYWQFMLHGSFFGQDLHPWLIWCIMWVMALHMIVPVPMYSLKFMHFRIRGNLVRYLLFLFSWLFLVVAGIPGLSLVILTYILLSLLNFLFQIRVSR